MNNELLAGGNKATFEMLEGKLVSGFKMSHMANVSGVFGIQVTIDSQARSRVITQVCYTRELKYGIQDCRPLGTPMYGNELSLLQPEDKRLDDHEKRRFQSVAGSSMHIGQATSYRISNALNQLARATPKPSEVHVISARHLLRCLAGPIEFGIT